MYLKGGGCCNSNKGKQRGRGSKLGNLERTYILNVPQCEPSTDLTLIRHLDVISLFVTRKCQESEKIGENTVDSRYSDPQRECKKVLDLANVLVERNSQ